ncbi:MAG: zinc ribbon domain-containing protein [Deltaproteobacteria bacterium]|nr:zinc ribbon domain-containing protein [Deltaproteobacteria bacterium]
MPTYEYRCPKCGVFETIQKITEDALKTCPTCSAPIQRLVSAPAFHLKGSGWYKTDYASGGSSPSSSSSGGDKASTPTGGESKGESKTESASSNTTSTPATESKPTSSDSSSS